MSLPDIPGIGNGESPLPRRVVKLMKFRNAASNGDYDNLTRQNARSLDVGSQGDVNAYKSLGLIVG